MQGTLGSLCPGEKSLLNWMGGKKLKRTYLCNGTDENWRLPCAGGLLGRMLTTAAHPACQVNTPLWLREHIGVNGALFPIICWPSWDASTGPMLAQLTVEGQPR